MTKRSTRTFLWPLAAAAGLAIVLLSILAATHHRGTTPNPAFTPALDPGTSMAGQAPDFTLTDQFAKPVSLHSFRGKVVILAFNDSECTTVCPLTTTAMVRARRMLGPAGSRVALLGVDANPQAISIKDVRSYSELHGMTHAWRFLTGSLPQLKRVWRSYKIDVAVEHGQIDHTPALFVIGPAGRLEKVYLTQMSYASIEQQAQLLAQEAAALLPDRPKVQSNLSYAPIPAIAPTRNVSVPTAGGGSIALGPGAPRLLAFFATWDSEVTDLGRQLERLGSYQARARTAGLPKLVAVDEGSVEPGPAALPAFLHSLQTPLSYPVAIDASGRLADGYEVQDEPWLVLVSATGRILWYYDVSTSGWLSTTALVREVRAAMSHPRGPSSSAQVQASLAGSPAPLAALHAQAGQLLGNQADFTARLRSLRGYPVVVNAWASWCAPCRGEFGLFASASAQYGRRVAFLGVDTSDSAGDARAFLAQHPVSYPSYQSSGRSALGSLAAVQGLPTTIFIDASGKVVYVHTGQYEQQGSLNQDIARYGSAG